MLKKRPLLLGTIILTSASFLSRFIGFLFRIFLSRTFPEEQIGLYQLVFPIYALCFSITSAGIETALSRNVAREMSLGNKNRANFFLYTSLLISIALSIGMLLFVRANASTIAIHMLGDMRCEPLLHSLVYALPYASVHSCICGYYLGLKQVKITALSQLIEQSVRVGSAVLLCLNAPDILSIVTGIVLSEFISALFCVCYYFRRDFLLSPFKERLPISYYFKNISILAFPLTGNRILTNLFQSMEAISLPLALQRYGLSNSDALGILGVMTGITLPCILFPSALTNSIATQMLPAVAEFHAATQYEELRKITRNVLTVCVLIGSASCVFFFLFAPWIGTAIFHKPSVSDYLKVICWICPFLYTNPTLSNIIHGLGRSQITFFINCLCIFVRILSIHLLVPFLGIKGYFLGFLTSQLLSFTLQLLYIRRLRLA